MANPRGSLIGLDRQRRMQGAQSSVQAPGPGSPVAATCDAVAVNKHGSQCSKAAGLYAARPVRMELGHKGTKTAGLQGIAHFLHQVEVVMQVVDARQHGP